MDKNHPRHTVVAFRAQRVADEPKAPLTFIEIVNEFPDLDHKPTQAKFQIDARNIAEALCNSLPGGTLDYLLAFLLEHRASQLKTSAK